MNLFGTTKRKLLGEYGSGFWSSNKFIMIADFGELIWKISGIIFTKHTEMSARLATVKSACLSLWTWTATQAVVITDFFTQQSTLLTAVHTPQCVCLLKFTSLFYVCMLQWPSGALFLSRRSTNRRSLLSVSIKSWNFLWTSCSMCSSFIIGILIPC